MRVTAHIFTLVICFYRSFQYIVMRVQCSLQELCLDKIAYYLPKKAHIEKLPLPLHMKKALNEYVYVCED